MNCPKGGWFLYNKDADMTIFSSVEKAVKTDYKGNESTEAVFNFLKDNQDKLGDDKEEEEKEGVEWRRGWWWGMKRREDEEEEEEEEWP